MAIAATDIKFYGSDHSAGGIDNLGGARTTSEISSTALHNIFDAVSGSESAAGDTEYRVIFVRNEHASLTWQNVRVYLETNYDDDISVGTKVAKNTDAQDLTDESTDPTGVTWESDSTYADGLALPDLAPNDYIALYLRRVIGAGAAAQNAAAFTINVDGDTAE